MRRLIAPMVIVVATAAGITAPIAGARTRSASGPSSARITRAIGRAEASRSLWATVNVCTRARHGGTIGIRGEMPGLGFPATLAMTITLERSTDGAFTPLPGSTATRTVALGTFSGHVHQGGAEFPFTTSAGLLDASVTFSWMRDGRTLGQVTRATTGGHPAAAFSRPAHHSASSCRLP